MKNIKYEDSINIQELIDIIKGTKQFFENREAASNVSVKGVADYVTKVDFSVQTYLKEKFKEIYPDISFLGEENYSGEELKGYTWIVDPVDGTTNLIHDFRESAVSVGLSDGVKSVLGIIYDPYRDEVYYAKRGCGAFCNNKPIHVSDRGTLDRSLVIVGTSPYYKEFADKNFNLFKEIFLKSEDIRRGGSAALELTRIASGRAEAYVEQILKIWDFAAGMLLVEEAGGAVTNYNGESVGMKRAESVIASNGIMTAELMELMNSLNMNE